MLQQPLRGKVVVPAVLCRHVPAHRISQAIVHVEQVRHFERIGNRLFRNALCHHRAHIFGAQVQVIERHLFEKAKYGAQPFVDGRAGVVVENLLCEAIVVKSGRRDRGVGAGSKDAGVQARYERCEQLALPD